MPAAVDKTGNNDDDAKNTSTNDDTGSEYAEDDEASSNATANSAKINTLAMKPFIATIYPWYSKHIDYEALKEARVSGVALFGGELYNSSHREQTYIDAYLESRVQECNNAGMPYSIYVNVRARDDIEADRECRALYYVISHCPPKLGLWLCIVTDNSISTNDSIIEIYYKYMESWGLKDRCGFYVTRSQLSSFSWSKFQDRMYLWVIDDDIDISSVDDELLNPELFEVP